MKRIMYLSLLLIIPFLAIADHGRDKLNGKWISPYTGQVIKLKVRRDHIKVKGLSRRGWTTYDIIGRHTFEDRNGNLIHLRNLHDLIYKERYRRKRIKFVKKGHLHHNHNCGSGCNIGNDYFFFRDNNSCTADSDYGYSSWTTYKRHDDYYGGRRGDTYDDYREGRGDRDYYDDYHDDRSRSSIPNGRYFAREIDEYIEIRSTRSGLKARRSGRDWVEYRQNRYRKNEYVDNRGNTYITLSDGSLQWKKRIGGATINLFRR